MATDMVLKINKCTLALAIAFLPASVIAGELTLTPSVNWEQTYTDNVELTRDSAVSSYVNLLHAIINSQYNSRLLQANISGSSTYVTYSHDHDLDDDFRTLNAQAKLFLWTGGPAIFANSSITNRSRNTANNGLADLVSADTVEVQAHSIGTSYAVDNSQFNIDASLQFQRSQTSDNIGEYQGYVANFDSASSATNTILWQVTGNYTRRTNNGAEGKIYAVEALLGTITDYGISPFIRYYTEDSTGNIRGNRTLGSSSWGPGARLYVSRHLYFDVSYNVVSDKTVSDNYLAAAVSWEPSGRTQLKASYNKRFFGDSYQLEFQHRSRRLTNSISYNETIEAFDRNSYRTVTLGNYFCPVDADISVDLTACFVDNDSNITFDDYQLVSIRDQELIEGNEFSLNKTLSWQSTLQLARTSFTLTANTNERESLTTGRKQNNISASFAIKRRISGRSNANLSYRFQQLEFDQDNLSTLGQKDDYRIVTASYDKSLASRLKATFALQYLDRDSTLFNRSYQEMRASFSLQKDF
jgi:uncharacterized protein (PEP-CTERM system associated)